jgi:hypothetical protein
VVLLSESYLAQADGADYEDPMNLQATHGEQIITVQVSDEDGNYTGREVDVCILYYVTIEEDYGADADGNRGIRLEEKHISESWIQHSKGLTPGEITRAIVDAERQFTDG